MIPLRNRSNLFVQLSKRLLSSATKGSESASTGFSFGIITYIYRRHSRIIILDFFLYHQRINK